MSNLEESYKKFREKNPQMSSFEIHCYESGYMDAVQDSHGERCKNCDYYQFKGEVFDSPHACYYLNRTGIDPEGCCGNWKRERN